MDLAGKKDFTPEEIKKFGIDPAAVAGYSKEQGLRIFLAIQQLEAGWRGNDVETVNAGIRGFQEQLPQVNPAEYPSENKRVVELWYNRTFHGTILNVFLYFIAMVLFLLAAVGVSKKMWMVGMPIFTLALLLHITSMGVRWWLAGRIPIQNQFESVLGSALIGCLVGWGLEMWRRNGMFGLAMSFVGFFATIACFAAPFVFGRDLGGSISKVAGILDNYWLYIHVNIVIGSYALIAASFILGAIYLCIRLGHWISPVEARPGAEPIGGFVPELVSSQPALGSGRFDLTPDQIDITNRRRDLLEKFDAANVIIMNMAFWFLGVGIICGAIWADRSWGRPWGWDPKETFALVTWLVYLIIVHTRFATRKRATVTAVLAVIGFLIMMFNWIGVNFFLVGLHSYA